MSAEDTREPLGLGKCLKEKVIHDDKVWQSVKWSPERWRTNTDALIHHRVLEEASINIKLWLFQICHAKLSLLWVDSWIKIQSALSPSLRLYYLFSSQTNRLRKRSLRVAPIHKLEPNSLFLSYVQRGAKVEDNKFWERWWWNDGVSPTHMPHVHLACSIHFRLQKYSDDEWWTS